MIAAMPQPPRPWTGVLLACLPLVALTSSASTAPATDATGVTITLNQGLLRLEPVSERIVRVAWSHDAAFFRRDSLMRAPASTSEASTAFTITEPIPGSSKLSLRTAALEVRVETETGAVAFFDHAGREILSERPDGRTLTPATVQGESTQHIRQTWAASPDEALYGLGQHQQDLFDIKGHDLDLWQRNGEIAVPFLVSSRGYGILWDNNGYTRFGDLRPYAPVPIVTLADREGRSGALSVTYAAGARFEKILAEERGAPDFIPPLPAPAVGSPEAKDKTRANLAIHPALNVAGPVGVRWEGSLTPSLSGDHLFRTFSTGDVKLWIDGKLLIDHWRQGWLPGHDVARVALRAGHAHALRVEWVRDQEPSNFRLEWKPPGSAQDADTSLWSEVGDGIDYYFVHGPALADVVAGYRTLTGRASLLPRWAFGLWQSRQRYETAQQSLDVVDEYRRRGIPLDVIVQDWLYWPQERWGSHEFDATRFPDPAGWVRALHERNARLLISVWPKFYPGTEHFAALQAGGFLYQPNLDQNVRDWIDQPYTFYDAFHPAARKLYWSQLEKTLLPLGVDAWWLDGTEPDLMPVPELATTHSQMMPTAGGTAARVLNAYPLVNSAAVYEGQRQARPDQRVAILTRSGFAGQQRHAAAVWSGDITSTWTALRKQLPAALGLSLSGLPYWTMDVGGFSVPARYNTRNPAPADLEDWRELNARWFQFGTFTPILRVHGEKPFRELWEFGGDDHPATRSLLAFNQLRYRLLPYIYSVAGAVTRAHDVFMRPLLMDFPEDAAVRSIADQYLFGPAVMVSPVLSPGARSRPVYLPATPGGWFDFWTGGHVAKPGWCDAPAPYERLPLHVRAGSILPIGPALTHTAEKVADELTVWIYAGADGHFTLQEDDGLTNAHERGDFSLIPLRWDDAARRLTVGDRAGTYAGMVGERKIRVMVVDSTRAKPFDVDAVTSWSLAYNGTEISLVVPR